MDVFVTGATGALGRPVVSTLARSGHLVRALVHSEASVARIRDAGAEPVRASLFDQAALVGALTGVDAVLHLATRIPPTAKAVMPSAWRDNDLIRRDGTRVLVDAALATGVATLVYPSITFGYLDRGPEWVDVGTPVYGARFVTSYDAEREVTWFARSGGRGVVLRFGVLYGPSAGNTAEFVAAAKRGVSPFPGPADAYASFLWTEDAAQALVAGLQAPSGTYDVVDDEPMRRADADAVMAAAVGREHLRRLPDGLNRFMPAAVAPLLRSQRVSNHRFRAATGWSPQVPSLREGVARLVPPPPPAEPAASAAQAT